MPETMQKVSQREANYRKGNGMRCSLCANFQPPESCAVVSGTISDMGVSDLFAAKDAAPQEAAPDPTAIENMLFGM